MVPMLVALGSVSTGPTLNDLRKLPSPDELSQRLDEDSQRLHDLTLTSNEKALASLGNMKKLLVGKTDPESVKLLRIVEKLEEQILKSERYFRP